MYSKTLLVPLDALARPSYQTVMLFLYTSFDISLSLIGSGKKGSRSSSKESRSKSPKEKGKEKRDKSGSPKRGASPKKSDGGSPKKGSRGLYIMHVE